MLAILSTHPIQYQIPLWQALAQDNSVPFEVWYLTDHGTRPSFDEQFGREFAWDIDTLSGYQYRFLKVNSGAKINQFTRTRLAEPLEQLFKTKNVTALWIQGWQVLAYWQAVWQAGHVNIPVWLRGESNDLAPLPWWKARLKRPILKRLFRRIDHFLYIGESNRRLYEKFGVRPEQLHPAPYCVDNHRFASQAELLRSQRSQIRREWKIADDAFCILFAGKLISKKRPFDLLSAAGSPLLKKIGRPLHLLFVGTGEYDLPLRQKSCIAYDAENLAVINEMPVACELQEGPLPVASFAGFLNQSEISKAYVAADCLVLPSNHLETWGLVVNEAMASGLPCIVSDACGCCEDLVSPLNPDYCFRMGNPDSLANSIRRLLEQPPAPAALAAHISKFSIQASVDTVKNLYLTTKKNS
ncbi:MAG: glycosyltransferase family 4 protein [Acidobacteria bacterium]|nr:glycosyltransferase family 4 protein [Acidobacteriota bacterium]